MHLEYPLLDAQVGSLKNGQQMQKEVQRGESILVQTKMSYSIDQMKIHRSLSRTSSCFVNDHRHIRYRPGVIEVASCDFFPVRALTR